MISFKKNHWSNYNNEKIKTFKMNLDKKLQYFILTKDDINKLRYVYNFL